MPIDETREYIIVPKDNTTLWRYMDVPTYLSLLTKNSLTFVRANLFEDKFEGRLPQKSAKEMIDISKKATKPLKLKTFEDILAKTAYLNCWCQENHQMVHMWKVYSKENGIAIETNYGSLKKSISSKENIIPSVVKYIDRENDYCNWKDDIFLTRFALKGKEYKSEKEFRLIIQFPEIITSKVDHLKKNNRGARLMRLYSETPVIKCKIDLPKLISKIHISPYSPKWYKEFIVDITQKYGLNVPIEQTKL